MRSQTASARAPQPSSEVNFDVPAGACDCHTHIFGDPKTFPFFPGRSYTPEPALPQELAALHQRLKIQRVVIVTPTGAEVPLGALAKISFSKGPAMIRDEDGALTGYVYLDLNTRDYGGFVAHADRLLREKLRLPWVPCLFKKYLVLPGTAFSTYHGLRGFQAQNLCRADKEP